MKKTINRIFVFCIAMVAIILVSCGTDEPKNTSSSSSTNKVKVTKPSFDKFLTTSTTAGFSLRVRFKTGGDKENNLSATVHWETYLKKPTTTPKKSELTNSESMRIYDVTYHKSGSNKGMTESVVFDKSHASHLGGAYVYYYVECYNSAGYAESSVDYTIIKR